MRGKLTRNKLKVFYPRKSLTPRGIVTGKVQEILHEIGPFDFKKHRHSSEVMLDSVERKSETTLENQERYEGEFLKGTLIKHGQGK